MNNQLIEALQWRYATKKYDPTYQLDPKDKETLEQVLQLTPTSYGLQPLHFIWLEDTALLEKTKSLAWNQQQIVDAAGVLVLCTKTELTPAYLDAHAHLHASVGSKPAEQIQVWNDKQAYIALGQLLTACALLQLDATPMEGFDPVALDDLLQLKEKGLHSVLICTIGQRAADDHYQHLKKVRHPKNSLFTTR